MRKWKIRWPLVVYDAAILLALDVLLLFFYDGLSWQGVLLHSCLAFACVFAARSIGRVYQQIWRYGGIQCYIRLLVADGVAFVVNLAIEKTIPLFVRIEQVSFARLLALSSMNALGALSIRMVYRYAFKCGTEDTAMGRFLRWLLKLFGGPELVRANQETEQKIKIAIIGAGRVGVNLAEELLGNANARYSPRCFVDTDPEKSTPSTRPVTAARGSSGAFPSSCWTGRASLTRCRSTSWATPPTSTCSGRRGTTARPSPSRRAACP